MSKEISLANIKGKRIPSKKVGETNKRIKEIMGVIGTLRAAEKLRDKAKSKSQELKLKEVKLNELIVVDGYVYMFTRPNTPLSKTDNNGLMLVTIEILKD